MNTELRGTHRTTFDAVFQHPIARNLTWRDVRAMIDALGDSKQSEHERTLKVTRNGHTLVLHRPFRQTITDVRELMNLRRFLEQSVAPTPLPAAAAHGEEQATHLLVVIDHRMARVYKSELHGSLPTRVIPYDRGGF